MLTYRPTVESDRARIAEWIAADPDHADKGNPDFFIAKPEEAALTFTAMDEHGDIFFVRSETIMRLHIQFAPPTERRRTARAIKEFTPHIASKAAHLGCKQLIFESVVEPLIKFLERHGFSRSPAEHVLDL